MSTHTIRVKNPKAIANAEQNALISASNQRMNVGSLNMNIPLRRAAKDAPEQIDLF
jgi:hypothetical protein